jgi:endonuclease YncB( thermonuclease family)
VGIDAPEYDQPHGAAARAALAAKVGGAVRVEGRGRDQHGRVLATLWNGDRDVNREMVADGWAWEFGGFVSDDDLADAEEAARRSRRGLWADPRAMRPSEWRALHPPHHSR